MANDDRAMVHDAIGSALAKEAWSSLYRKAFPATLQNYEMGAVLPAAFYMFRFGERRGRGEFLNTYGDRKPPATEAQRKSSATVDRVAERLAASAGSWGFDGDAGKAILGDLMLTFCLENLRHAEGRNKPVARAAPTHYFASWLDLPQRSADLRGVPELIVALLADQDGVAVSAQGGSPGSPFPVGGGFESNLLLQPFLQGVGQRGGLLANRNREMFEEGADRVGLDQLATIRIATMLPSAPNAALGATAGEVSNQRAIARKASERFAQDLRAFLQAYSRAMPRHALVDMIEACAAVGMATVFSSVTEMLLAWSDDGRLPSGEAQRPAPLLVDCSKGLDRQIRRCAERSADDFLRKAERLPNILMALRLLDHHARRTLRLDDSGTIPYATNWINQLGDLMHLRHVRAERVHLSIEEKAENLLEACGHDHVEASDILNGREVEPNPVWRLARSLCVLMGTRMLRQYLFGFVDSSLMTARHNGLGVKRTVIRNRRRREALSIAFSDPAIECLVHLHMLRDDGQGLRKLPFGHFLDSLRERHGLHIDVAPPGMSIANDTLRRNRALFERRLRDLGLLAGVNDAESMKRLRPRFHPTPGDC